MSDNAHKPAVWQRFIQKISSTRPAAWILARVMHIFDRQVLRLTDGAHTLTSLLTGLPILMLTTTGARSGKSRTVPLVGIHDHEKTILIASNFGRACHPNWYHNLKANAKAQLTIKGQNFSYISREAEGDEREKYWQMAVELFPGYKAYEGRTQGRRIPVMVLEPEEKLSVLKG